MSRKSSSPERQLDQLVAVIESYDQKPYGHWRVERRPSANSTRTFIVVTPPQGGDMVNFAVPSNVTAQHTVNFRRQVEALGFPWVKAEAAHTEHARRQRQERFDADRREQDERAEQIAARAAEKAAARAAAKAADDTAQTLREWAAKCKPGGARFTVSSVLITAAIADDYLTHRNGPKALGCNRPMVESKIARYGTDMRAGRWADSPEPIIIDWDNHLLDGQHRFEAIRRTGVACYIDIVFNADPAVFVTLDTGGGRTAADVLATELGIGSSSRAKNLTAALRILVAYDTSPVVAWPQVRIENREVASILEDYPGLTDQVTLALSMTSMNQRRNGRDAFAPSVALAFVHIATRAWPGCEDKIRDFVRPIMTGHDQKPNSPQYAVAEYLRISRKQAQGRGLDTAVQLMVLLKGWNRYMMGKMMRVTEATFDRDENMVEACTPAMAATAKVKTAARR